MSRSSKDSSRKVSKLRETYGLQWIFLRLKEEKFHQLRAVYHVCIHASFTDFCNTHKQSAISEYACPEDLDQVQLQGPEACEEEMSGALAFQPRQVHTYIHTCIHVYMCTYIHTYIHAYLHVYIYIYMHKRVYICIYICYCILSYHHLGFSGHSKDAQRVVHRLSHWPYLSPFIGPMNMTAAHIHVYVHVYVHTCV